MKVSIVRGGGLAGLVTTTAVESESLSPEHARELRARVKEAGVLELPDRVSARPGHADHFNYAVTVEDEDRRHSVRLTEDAVPEEVRALISWLDSVPEREERIASPGEDTLDEGA